MQVLDTLSIGRPVTRGALALFPLYTHARRTADYVPGPIAARDGLVSIDEAPGANVPTLSAVVTGSKPVLLIEGETFVGGLQNRVLNVSVLLPPGERPVPVACVEAHRWGSRARMTRSDYRAPRRLRRTKNRSVAMSVRDSGARYADQGAVWSEVDAALQSRRASAPTSALHTAFDATFDDVTDANVLAVEELAELGPLPEQMGVVIAAGGRCLSAELFDRADTLAAYWPTIVRSSALDLPAREAQRPTLGDALRFVRRVRKAERIPRSDGVRLPAVQSGTDIGTIASAGGGQGLVIPFDGSGCATPDGRTVAVVLEQSSVTVQDAVDGRLVAADGLRDLSRRLIGLLHQRREDGDDER